MKSRYGFDWPDQISDPQIDLILWKHHAEEPYAGHVTDPWDHGLRAARALFDKKDLVISPLTEEHFYDWTTEDFCVTWGGASCSKSNDLGMIALLDWITDPTETYCVMASTTKEMLKVRSYESVVRYFRLLKRNPYFLVPGKESHTTTMILNDGDADDASALATPKASLRGVAVKEGPKDKARANLQGAHLPYVRLILDEMAQLPEAAVEARTNLSIGCRSFKFAGLANPDSFTDLSARYSKPDHPLGWGSIDKDTPTWRSVYGKVRHHNGFNSPSLTEPDGERKYPYLITRARIDQILKENQGNADAPEVWTMIVGFPPPTGSALTVLSSKDISAFHATETVTWNPEMLPELIRVAGLDPAFTGGGDNCALQPGLVGILENGVYALALEPLIYIPILASDSRPVTYQISDFMVTWCASNGVSMSHVAVDDSGTQSVADVLQHETRVAPIRCNFGARASDSPISGINPQPARQRVSDQVTEIWTLFAELVRAGQARGLGDKAMTQFTSRQYTPGRRPLKLETKNDYKARTGTTSPDEADAVALCALAARRAAGLFPGKEKQIISWSGGAASMRRSLGTPVGSYRGSGTIAGYGNLGLDTLARF